MNNYEFLAAWAAEKAHGSAKVHRSAKVLDFGCGAGQIVALMRAKGIDALGCDAWYGGGSYEDSVPREIRPYICGMDGSCTRFPDSAFDLIVSNQVLEHVPDLDATAAEIARILKPGGVTLHLFPDRSIWREGHCGIAFAHWFPKGGRARLYHLLVFRLMGFGHFKKDLSPLQWSRDFCKWLDDWTFYRPLEEIHATFGKYFSSIRHLEERWFEARFGVSLPVALERFIVRKGGGLAIELTK